MRPIRTLSAGLAPASLVLAALVLAAGGLAGCSKPPASTTASAPLTVSVAPVAVRPIQGNMVASGLLISREEAGVAAELSGYRVAKVFVEQGAIVRAGQPLAQLDDTLLRAQIDQARANVAQQEVAAERAEAEAGRVAGLDNQGVLSQEAIAERRLAARSARAAVAVAQAQLKDLQTRETRMVIRAPVGGTVLERTARPGDTSSPATGLFRIARGSLVELDAEVPEDQLHRVAVGEHVDVQLPSGAHVGGTVRLINPTVDQQTKLGRARVALPVRADLRPGGYGRATFSGLVRQVPATPESAVRFDADGASVMVVGADNRVRRVAVRTGQRGGGFVELLQGPAPGARVVLGGSAFLLEGDAVRIAPSAATPARTAS